MMALDNDPDELSGEEDITLDDDIDSFDIFSGDSLEPEHDGEDELGLEVEFEGQFEEPLGPQGSKTTLDESGVYSFEVGEYTIQTPAGALSVDDGPKITEGVAELVGDKLTVSEPSKVWLPEGTVLHTPIGKSALGTPLEFSIEPASGDLTEEFTINVLGASPSNRVDIKINMPWKTDPIVTSMTGSGTITVRGETIAARAKLPLNMENKVTIYAKEIIAWWPDKKSNEQTIYVITTRPEPPVEPPIEPPVEPPIEPPVEPPVELPITPEEAAAGIAAGKQYWIKSTWPWFDLLPGLPYFVGIPILPGFRISETM